MQRRVQSRARQAAVLALIPLLLLALATPAGATATGVAYVVVSSQTVDIILEETVYEQAVSVPAATTNATGATTPGIANISITLPQGWNTVDSIIVSIEQASGNAKLVALDANGTQLASADIVPLATGPYTVTLPGETSTIEIQNLASTAWSGTIKIVVQATVSFQLVNAPSQITVQPGQQAKATLTFKQISGPAGFFSLRDVPGHQYDAIIDVWSEDPDSTMPNDMEQETTGAGWQGNIVMVVYVASNAQDGTYNVPVELLFTTQSGVKPQSAGILDLTVTLSGANGDVGKNQDNSVNWGYIGIGAVAALFLVMIAGGKGGRGGRRGVSPLLAALVITAIAALAFGLLDFNPQFSVDWKWLGVGAIAALFLLMLTRPTMVQRAARRIGL